MRQIWLSALLVFVFPAMVFGQDLEGIKCPINPDVDVSADAMAEHMKGTVYFCCQGCVGKFKKDPKAYAEAANFQLVATGQFEQKGCPFSGAPVTDGNSVKIGETEVGFCCGNCKGKVENAGEMADQVKLVFAAKAFEKGFAKKEASQEIDLSKAECLMMEGEAVAAKHAAAHRDGKVFFCCGNCVKAFNKDPEKYEVAANKQLVQTGQFKQTGCPFSGAPVTDGNSVKIGETEVGFCCGNCKGKVANAEDDAARAEMVFSKKAFEKGFAKSK